MKIYSLSFFKKTKITSKHLGRFKQLIHHQSPHPGPLEGRTKCPLQIVGYTAVLGDRGSRSYHRALYCTKVDN